MLTALTTLKGLFTGRKMVVYAVVGLSILGIWAAMKYDNKIIRGLESSLTETKAERDSAIIDAKINSEVREIDDKILKDQLEGQDEIDDETRDAVNKIDIEVGKAIEDIDREVEKHQATEEPIEVDIASNERGEKKNDVQPKSRNEKQDTGYISSVNSAVASSAINGMWDYYCNAVEDTTGCS